MLLLVYNHIPCILFTLSSVPILLSPLLSDSPCSVSCIHCIHCVRWGCLQPEGGSFKNTGTSWKSWQGMTITQGTLRPLFERGWESDEYGATLSWRASAHVSLNQGKNALMVVNMDRLCLGPLGPSTSRTSRSRTSRASRASGLCSLHCSLDQG